MNNLWREIGFIDRRKPKKDLKIVRIKKRIVKSINKFKKNRQELVQLEWSNRIKRLVIEELERRLVYGKARRKYEKGLKTGKSLRDI